MGAEYRKSRQASRSPHPAAHAVRTPRPRDLNANASLHRIAAYAAAPVPAVAAFFPALRRIISPLYRMPFPL